MATINPEWVEIQTGLFMETVTLSAGSFLRLHAADGYCFYDLSDEYYDEEGNLIPEENVTPEMRNYSVICVTPVMTIEQLNARFVSVVREDWMGILNNPTQNETI